jgi:DNA-binding response OmpR family regulator
MTTQFDTSKVLIVDDEPSVANALRRMLLTEGYHVRTAAEGRNALASSRSRPCRGREIDIHVNGNGGSRSYERARHCPESNRVAPTMLTCACAIARC